MIARAEWLDYSACGAYRKFEEENVLYYLADSRK